MVVGLGPRLLAHQAQPQVAARARKRLGVEEVAPNELPPDASMTQICGQEINIAHVIAAVVSTASAMTVSIIAANFLGLVVSTRQKP
ncbi:MULTISPECIES: hypothetical protein [unclassified Variovorax]|uniref:hypothetical protein n=1 Tax=unclassified Variovorax TaxID=663243 RepID=UPI000AABBB72|nr:MULTISPECIES: hypothetical protein [unclassified Variovorax]